MPTQTLSKTRRSTVVETVLVVESDILVRMTVADYLRERGYTVIEALNVGEALEILRSETKVDALYSEVELHGDMDGFALARTARREFPSLDIILASGSARQAQRNGRFSGENMLPKSHHSNELRGR
jgi:CheY-like chemotaxis protein